MDNQLNYGEIKNKLDEVIAKMQDTDTDLDQALKLHEDGKKLVKQLESYLKDVEKKIEDITKDK